MKFGQEHQQTLLELLSWRRDVRHFKTTPLLDEDIEKLLEAIDMAPSVGNSRPWKFVRVNSQDIRDEIYKNFLKSNNDAAENYNDEEASDYRNLKLAGLKEAPLQLAIFTDLEPKTGRGLGRQTMPETLLYSTIMAIQNLWLVARSLNIGVGWVSILEPGDMNELLKAPENWKFTAYLCIGYPAFDSKLPELHEKQWQSNIKTDWIDR